MTDKLPGEGETKLIERKRVRRECENCGEPAFYLNTYLNDGGVGARRNPASSAYGRDDCTFSSDHDQYLCGDCHATVPDVGVPEGFGWCATFECCERYAHKFLTWEEREIERAEAAQ